MQPNTEESHNGNGTCTNDKQVQACACCAALAQLRMPWMDAAIQHAAPHYPPAQHMQPVHYQQAPYNPYPQQAPYNPQGYYHPQYQATENGTAPATESDSGESRKTTFFKLPGFGKAKKKLESITGKPKNKSKHSRIGDGTADNAKSAGEESVDGNGTDPDTEKPEANNDKEDGADSSKEWQDEVPPSKAKFRLLFGLQGLAVSLFGIILPAWVIVTSIMSTPKRITLVALHHPVETILEFLLVAGMPLVNYLVWSAICKSRTTLSRWLVMALGASVGTGLVISGFCFASLFGSSEGLVDAIGSNFSMGFLYLSALSFLSAAVSAYLANRLRLSWVLSSSRLNVSVQAITGLVLALLTFAGAEYRPWCIRMAQYNALAKDDVVRKEGLKWLRQINPEREMRMECKDSRAAGLAGLFFPIKSSAQHQLYFTLTGTPYSFRDADSTDLSSMPNDYLSRHVVGDVIPQLDLTRSSLNGVLHANTLTSTLNWTFVIKNGSSTAQEARAEIELPIGAAVSGLKVWHKGEAEPAEFVATGKVEGASMTTAGGDTPAMVTDLGHGRVLLHCYPVPGEEELKVMVSMVVPLKSESDGLASLVTPQLIASNFGMDGEHLLRLRSQTELLSGVKGLSNSYNAAKESIIAGSLSKDQMESSPLVITAKREQISKPFAVQDKIATIMRRQDEQQKERIRVERERQKEKQRQQENNKPMGQVVFMIDGSKGMKAQLEDYSKLLSHKSGGDKKVIKPRIITIKPQYTIESVEKIEAPAPTQLVVVIDGSVSMQKYSKDLKEALSKLPKTIPTKVIIATQENQKQAEIPFLSQVLPNLEKMEFVGGQDNLKSVVQASELAGETKGAAVLWIHGPQPVLNPETYIMSPYESAPAFYELPVVAGTDTFEFFKNHSEIGPFTQVPRNSNSVSKDLISFFAKWNPNNNGYVATISETETLPKDVVKASEAEGKELLMLRAVQDCEKLIATRHFRKAARLALAYGFVSPVSSAYMGNNTPQQHDADAVPSTNDSNTEQASNGEAAQNSDGSNTATNSTTTPDQTGDAANAPMLQGASNGTVGAQGSDATVIMGVNTAGTVRVNNLANLEALLNIIANMGELGALLSGVGLMIHGFMNKAVVKLGEDVELGQGGRIILGGILAIFGLALPGVINWFVASARDANLFS